MNKHTTIQAEREKEEMRNQLTLTYELQTNNGVYKQNGMGD